MLKSIVEVAPELLNFIESLQLPLTRPQKKHVSQVADALITTEGSKTLSALYRSIVGDPCPKSAADTFREAPWTANEQIPVRHPELPHIDKIIDLRFYVELVSLGADSRNVVILGDHMIDRSPCGTGTCAEAALRYARGKLGLGEPFVTESIIGTRFTGQVIAETQVGGSSEVFPAVIPQVTGSAFITGYHQFVLDGEDPFPEGFRLKA